MEDRTRRVVTTLVAFGALFVMMVHYGAVAAEPGHDPNMAAHRALESPDQHVGENLYMWTVVATDTPNGFVVKAGGHRYAVSGTDATPSPGDAIQMVGNLRDGNTIVADRVVVSPRPALQYLYAISIGGLLVTVVVFVRRWRFDRATFTVRPRGDE